MSDTIINTWRNFHKTSYKPALTGTLFIELVRFYKLDNVLFKGMNVLEIGVGLGYCTKGFYEMGCNVYALDICKKAFRRIKKYIKGSYLHGEVENLPDNFFDLIVSHLVTQHMSEADILKQFPEVIRSLKSKGIFRVQFAGSDIMEENNRKETIVGSPADNKVSMLGGRMVRTPEYAKDLVERCGGEVSFISEITKFPKYKSYWYWMEIIKSRADSLK